MGQMTCLYAERFHASAYCM